MKIKRASSKSGLFLIELIIAIVFFALASAICTQLFVQAHLMSTKSRDMSMASNLAQNYAESLRGTDTDMLRESFGRLSADTGGAYGYFDSGGTVCATLDEAAYALHLELDNSSAPLYEGTVTVFRVREGVIQAETLCALPVARYAPE